MPKFGDYETVGDPFSVAEEDGHVGTVWQASKTDVKGGAVYAVKLFAPRVRKSSPDLPEGELDNDRALEFLEGIKQLKKSHAEGGTCLAPIHDFGLVAEGAWYATDYYPRSSLQRWIKLHGEVDAASLRHIVHSVATGCLALKQSRGYSHGNLKASNILLAGKPRPIPKTPVVLMDPYPAAAVQVSGLEGADRATVGELINQVTEVQDLAALGEVLLQLVEGRVLKRGYYNYPIQSSQAWTRMGKAGERLRQLCNGLLDPKLTLEAINFEKLEREYRPSATDKFKPYLVGAGAVAVVALLVLFVVLPVMRSRTFDSALEDAKRELRRSNFEAAEAALAPAERIRPKDPSLRSVKQRIAQGKAERDGEFGAELAKAQQLLRDQKLEEALASLEAALKVRPGEPSALQLQAEVNQKIGERDRATANASKFAESLNLAKQEFAAGRLDTAARAISSALQYNPGNAEAQQLQTQILTRTKEIAAQAEADAEFARLMSAGQSDFGAGRYSNALAAADQALKIKSRDPAALQLQKQANDELNKAAGLQQSLQAYQAAMAAATNFWSRGDLSNALQQVRIALNNRSGDRTAQDLQGVINEQERAAAQKQAEEKRFTDALASADKAFKLGTLEGLTNALNSVGVALVAKPGEPRALDLQNKIRSALKDREAALESQAKYDTAMKQAGAFIQSKAYTNALAELQVALRAKNNDSRATQLQQQVYEAINKQQLEQKQEADFKGFLTAASTAYQQGDLTNALAQVNKALEVFPTRTEGMNLLRDIRAKMTARTTPTPPPVATTTTTPPPATNPPPVTTTTSIAPAMGVPSIPGIPSSDWVWVPSIGTKGAYVQRTELSYGAYQAISQARGLTVESAQSLGSDAKPAVFASASAARDFATAAGARLPRQDEYLRMLREASFQVNDQGQIGVDAVNPIKAAENIANQNPDPSSVKEVAAGAAAPQKLAYLLGNVREWTGDAAAPFGISYMAELIGRQVRLTATAKERSEVVGVRLLVEAR